MRVDRPVAFLMVLAVAMFCRTARAEAAGAAFPRYTLRVITGIPIPNSSAKALNARGDVLIWATSVEEKTHHAYLWSNGKVAEIGTLGGRHQSSPPANGKFSILGTIGYGLNDRGQVVGVSQAPDGCNHAFLWERGKMRDLKTLGGKASEAWDISNLGQVVGYSETASGEEHAFVWDTKRGMRDLGVPGRTSRAYAINNKSQILGLYTPGMKTFVCQNGKITYPKDYPAKDFGPFQGLNINDAGDIIGGVTRGGSDDMESRVYLYSAGKAILVETPAKASSNAFGLNSNGMVVGNAFDTPTGQHSFVWRDGKTALLNDLLVDPEWDIFFALAVNDRGQIAANGMRRKLRLPVLLTPLP